jgi:short-subunit dehydrogenase
MKLEDARVVLTGAAGGIGSAVARRLAAGGAKLLLTDLRQEPLDRLAAELASPAAVLTVAADVGSDAGRTTLASAAHDFGANVLINAAGINPFGLFEEQSAGEIAKAFAVNALAPILLCHALLPVLRKQPRAQLVNVGSTFGSIGFPGFTAYAASKFAVRGFCEALRRELADTAITVHYVAPRATATALATERVRAMNAELGVGMDTPQTVAAEIERVLVEERRERLLGTPERLFAKLNALFPALVDRSLKRQLAVVRRYAAPASAAPAAVRATAFINQRLEEIES